MRREVRIIVPTLLGCTRRAATWLGGFLSRTKCLPVGPASSKRTLARIGSHAENLSRKVGVWRTPLVRIPLCKDLVKERTMREATTRDHHHLLTGTRPRRSNRLLLITLAVCPDATSSRSTSSTESEAGAIDLAFSTVDLDLARSRAEAPHPPGGGLGDLPPRSSRRRPAGPQVPYLGSSELNSAESIRVAPRTLAGGWSKRDELAVL